MSSAAVVIGALRGKGRTSLPGVCIRGYVPLSHPGNIDMRTETTTAQIRACVINTMNAVCFR